MFSQLSVLVSVVSSVSVISLSLHPAEFLTFLCPAVFLSYVCLYTHQCFCYISCLNVQQCFFFVCVQQFLLSFMCTQQCSCKVCVCPSVFLSQLYVWVHQYFLFCHASVFVSSSVFVMALCLCLLVFQSYLYVCV